MKPIDAVVETEITIVLRLTVEQAAQLRDFTSGGLKAKSACEDEDPAIAEPRITLFKALSMVLRLCE